jgi:hypothetical protein
VARAGRSGTAYSLVAPDEVPYLLDLHLFLGRSVTLARPCEEPSGEARLDWAWVPMDHGDHEQAGVQWSDHRRCLLGLTVRPGVLGLPLGYCCQSGGSGCI